MRDRRRASATRDGDGFRVLVPRPRTAEFYELYVHDNGKIDGLPGTPDEDTVLIWIAETEIRAEGWPSVGRAALKHYRLI